MEMSTTIIMGFEAANLTLVLLTAAVFMFTGSARSGSRDLSDTVPLVLNQAADIQYKVSRQGLQAGESRRTADWP